MDFCTSENGQTDMGAYLYQSQLKSRQLYG